jgi:hypothetical protein
VLLFAELEMAANAAVLNQLANVMVSISGAMVPGMFRKPSTIAHLGDGAADTGPTVTMASGAVMDRPVGKTIAVAGIAYTILAAAPDGTGLTVLTLGDAE